MSKVTCPTCQREMEVRQLSDWPSFPFCSARCRMADLGRWLDEAHRVPADDEGLEEDDAPPPGD